MENKQALIQKKQELAALENKLQQLPKEGSGGLIGIILTVVGIMLFLLDGGAGSGIGLMGIFAFLVGVIWWIAGSSTKSSRKKAIEQVQKEILKTKNEIITLEHE